MSSAEKLAFILEAAHGPLWNGKCHTLNERLQKIYGRESPSKLKARRETHFRWMKSGPKRPSEAIEALCAAIQSKFAITINPHWIVDNDLSLIDFAAKLGFTEIELDYAMQDLKLNDVRRQPELLSAMGQHVRMRAGIWLVERCTDEERSTRRSTGIFVTPKQMLKYRGGSEPRACHFAYLFVPFGGIDESPLRRPGMTKYVGSGAYVDGSLAFHFRSEGRTPPDMAAMWIMASNDSHTRYDGGYVSNNIDRKKRPGVRWINLSYLAEDVSMESIDRHCRQYVRSADDLAREQHLKTKQSPRQPATTPTPKQTLTTKRSPRKITGKQPTPRRPARTSSRSPRAD